jgi:hypothetical protein
MEHNCPYHFTRDHAQGSRKRPELPPVSASSNAETKSKAQRFCPGCPLPRFYSIAL